MNERWKSRKKPAALEARFDFSDFENLRAFLDELAEQAELLNHYPNISFTRTRVSVVISSKTEVLEEIDRTLAKGIDESYLKFVDLAQGAAT
ncbi:4a-hydroxytetrahydrobiopterin dehydratase [Candidatus Thioglobus sp.]|uniref:4a-hydroxytetrahydrobiopterin dehydratase n=1 Tax=Candidatus Thioglobus sp. TaxID=2026721 RepID=UPI003D11EB44